jgi:hypothetical protein
MQTILVNTATSFVTGVQVAATATLSFATATARWIALAVVNIASLAVTSIAQTGFQLYQAAVAAVLHFQTLVGRLGGAPSVSLPLVLAAFAVIMAIVALSMAATKKD